MLSSIKNKTKGWVAYLIVGLIVIPFALFGINEYFTGAANIIVASVDDKNISKQEFLDEFNPQKRRLQQKLAEKYNTEFDTFLKQSTLSQMIDRYLLDRLAEHMAHATTASELNAIIQANEAFKDEGRFSLDKYKQLLRLNGYTPTQYEGAKSQELTQTQIKYNLLDSAFVLPSQLKRLQELNDQERQFSYVKLDAKDYIKQVQVDETSVKNYYDKQQKIFFIPEQVSVEFVELSLAEIAKNVLASDDELHRFYEEEQARFATEEERQAQHILLADETLATKVLALLKQGGDFNQLAAQYSQDTGSKDTGGDLGFFTRGMMVGAFEDNAFAMREGELSDLVKSEFGYHIIKLNKIKRAKTKPFAEVKAELTQLYRQSQAQKNLYNLTEQLATLSYETNLEEVSSQLGLELQTSDFFDKDTQKLDAKIVKAAFGDAVFNKNENSEILELAQERFVVLRLKEKLAKRQQTFEEVKSEIDDYLKRLLAKKFVDKVAGQIVILSRAGDLAAVEKIMNKDSLKWTDVDWIKRNSDKVDASIIGKVFSLPKPKSGALFSAQDLDERSSIVMKLSSVRVIESSVNYAMLEQALSLFEAEEVFVDILKTLRSKAEIKIFNRNL
jgi:peptidyl-prolyl cis-trans isomerase D